MKYKLIFLDLFLKDLSKLEQVVQKNIIKKLTMYVESGRPLDFAVKLSGLKKRYRFRVGVYRIILLVCLAVDHRSSVYN